MVLPTNMDVKILPSVILSQSHINVALLISINTNQPKKVLNNTKSYITCGWLVRNFVFTIVKFRILWTYNGETLSWAKFTIVTALAVKLL